MGQDVILACGVWLGSFVVLGDRASIGARTRVLDGVCIGDDVSVGEDCELGTGCVLLDGVRLGDRVRVGPSAVLGADGFGFVEDQGVHHKIPQVGGVEVGDRVVIGPGACIDRGTTSDTVIGAESRIGPQVQIGHNVRIGARCNLGALTGIAGSCTLEADVTMGEACGTLPHQVIREGAVCESRTGVTKEVAAHSHVEGYPMRPWQEHRWLHEQLDKVPALVARLEALEQREAEVAP
jgi:UDP-3-O-[3-hydroxymyristoyl] glucosamine N-acyltransferase